MPVVTPTASTEYPIKKIIKERIKNRLLKSLFILKKINNVSNKLIGVSGKKKYLYSSMHIPKVPKK